MQSININHLITQDQLNQTGIPTPTLDPKTLNNPFETHPTPTVLSNATQNASDLLYAMMTEPDTLTYAESKNAKRRTFHLNFTTRFLTLNKRKASKDDFKKLSKRLKALCIAIHNTPQVVLRDATQVQDPTEVPNDNVLTKIAQILGIDSLHHLAQLKSATDTILSPITDALRQLIQSLNTLVGPDQKPRVKTKITTADFVDVILRAFQDILGANKQVTISNDMTKMAATETRYTLGLTQSTAHYIERSTSKKNEVTIQFDAKTAQLNDQAMTPATLEWYILRLHKVGNDLKQNKASITKTR